MRVMIPVAVCLALVACDGGVEAEKTRQLAAFGKCETALARTSRDPEKVEVPNIEPRVTSTSYEFSWPGLGQGIRVAENLGFPVEAKCYVSRETQRVEYLMLGGKVLKPEV